MTMTCVNCDNIHGCSDARAGYACDQFTYVQYLKHRGQLVAILGEKVAVKTLKESKSMVATDHTNTATIKTFVSEGALEELAKLRDASTMPLPYLVMATSHLVGDSAAIGKMLRGADSKRDVLVDLLIDLAAENGRPVDAPADAPVDVPFEVAPPDAPKKKRKRRSKAQIEADRAAKAAEDAAQAEHSPPVELPPNGPVSDVATEAQVTHVIGLISSAVEELSRQNSELEASLNTGITSLHSRFALVANYTRLERALIALEEGLLLSGVLIEPVVQPALEGTSD